MDHLETYVVVDNPYITVWHLPAHGIIHHRMHRYTRGAPFRDALIAGVEVMERRGASKWLSDDRANNALPPADEEWAREVWFPRTRAAGWRHWAIVQPLKVLGQMNVRRFAEAYAAQGITARIFSDPNAAMAWLCDVD